MNSKRLENMRWWQKGHTGRSGEFPRDESGGIDSLDPAWAYSTWGQLTLMSYFWLTLGPTRNLLSLPPPAQVNLREQELEKLWLLCKGCWGLGPHPWAAAGGNKGRNLGIGVTNIPWTLWNSPRRDRRCPSGTRGGSWSHPRASQALLLGWWRLRTSWNVDLTQSRANPAAKPGQEQLGKIIGWHMATSFSKGFQGYKVVWSVLAENKKTLWYFHHQIVKCWALNPEDWFFSPFPLFWGCNCFVVKMPNYSSLLNFCPWKGVSGVKIVLNFLPTLLLVKLLHFLELPKRSFLNWRNPDPVLVTANNIKRWKCCETFFSALNSWLRNRF